MMKTTQARKNARSSSDIQPRSVCCWCVSPFGMQRSDFLAHGERPKENGKTMKKTSARKKIHTISEDMRREYRFDYKKVKPNRFVEQLGVGTIAVVLEPDVAAVFKSSESVNTLLRSVIAALPANAEP